MKETGFDNFQSDVEELLLEIDRTTQSGNNASSSKKRKNEDDMDLEGNIDGKREIKDN
jgi:hypothetical protein